MENDFFSEKIFLCFDLFDELILFSANTILRNEKRKYIRKSQELLLKYIPIKEETFMKRKIKQIEKENSRLFGKAIYPDNENKLDDAIREDDLSLDEILKTVKRPISKLEKEKLHFYSSRQKKKAIDKENNEDLFFTDNKLNYSKLLKSNKPDLCKKS